MRKTVRGECDEMWEGGVHASHQGAAPGGLARHAGPLLLYGAGWNQGYVPIYS